jgi:hypothetical protein
MHATKKYRVFLVLTVVLLSVHRLLVMANVVPSSQILVTQMMEALRSYETSVLTRATQLNIPEYDILHSHRRENLKSYISNFVCYFTSSHLGWLRCMIYENDLMLNRNK